MELLLVSINDGDYRKPYPDVDLSDKLQYLDWNDFRKYVQALHESRSYLLHDSSYITSLHEQHLACSKLDSKKQSRYVHHNNYLSSIFPHAVNSYKQRVVCYLLSHVNACQLPALQIALLRSLAAVSNGVKAQMLTPSLQVLSKDIASATVDILSRSTYQEHASLLVSSLDVTAVNDLNDADKPLWSIFTDLIRISLCKGTQPLTYSCLLIL